MASASYSFIDVAAVSGVRERFASGAALIVLSTDLERILWSNGQGAAIFGYPDIEAAIGASPRLPLAARRQIMSASGFPIIDGERTILVRIATGVDSSAYAFTARTVRLPGDEAAILLAAAVYASKQDDSGAAQSAVGGFGVQTGHLALIDAKGEAIAATPGYAALGIRAETLTALAREIGGGERLAKRLVEGDGASYPSGLARLTDEPAVHLLVVVNEGRIGHDRQGEIEKRVDQGSQTAVPEARIDPRSDERAPLHDNEGEPDDHDQWYFNAARGDVGKPGPNLSDAAQAPLPPAPVRFVWRTDAQARFSAISPEFAQLVGAPAADVMGRPFSEVATAFDLDPSGEIGALLERRDTWSGRSVLWPVAGSSMRLPVDLAALPVHGRDRTFEGFRGFGVARPGEAEDDPQGLGLKLVADGVPGADQGRGIGSVSESEPPADPFRGEVPALAITPKPERRHADKVIRLAEHREAANDKGLSTVERTAFREIGERLKKDTGAAEAQPEDQATAQLEPVGLAVDGQPDEAAPVSEAGAPESVGAASGSGSLLFPEPGDGEADLSGPEASPNQAELFAPDIIGPDNNGMEPLDVDVPQEAAASFGGEDRPAQDPEALPRRSEEAGDTPRGPRAAGGEAEALANAPPFAKEELALSARLFEDPEPPASNAEASNATDEAASDSDAETSALETSARQNPSDAGPVGPKASNMVTAISLDAMEDEASLAESAEPASTASNEGQDKETAREPTEGEGEPPTPRDSSLAVWVWAAIGLAGSLSGASRRNATSSPDETLEEAKSPPPGETGLSSASLSDPIAPDFASDSPPASLENHASDDALDHSDSPAELTPRRNDGEKGGTATSEVAASEEGDEAADEPDRTRAPVDTSILERLPVPVLIHAGDRLHYANPAFLSLTGYASVDELALEGGLGALFAQPVAEEETDRMLHLRTAGGEAFPIDALLRSVPWNGGKALMLVVRRASDDGRPAAEAPLIAELQSRIAEMRTIIDTATDGVVLITPDGTIRSISRPAEALFGFESDEVAGKPFASLFAVESQRAARDYLHGLTENGVASVLNDGREVIGREARGRYIPLFMTLGRLPGDSGYCAVVRDITHWKRAEEELTKSRAQAERASSLKSDFLARVSHEIRTPLNAIIGFSELMVDEKFGAVANERYRDYLRDINRSGNHVLDLVNDLLDISKIEAGQQEMAHEAVSLNDTLAETVAMMQPQANRERVIIRSSFASRLPEVVADLRSVRQIALNILSNAVRYTQAGGQVIVSTSYEPTGDIVMRVRDTGVGMTQAEIEQALKPFKQLNALKRARGDGTGLGLPLTKAMVEANRAQFAIQSTPGEGTLVEVVFPSTRVLAH